MGTRSGAAVCAGAGNVSMILVVSRPYLRSGSGRMLGAGLAAEAPLPPRSSEVEPVSVVWSEMIATSACVGRIRETELFARRNLGVYGDLYPGNPG